MRTRLAVLFLFAAAATASAQCYAFSGGGVTLQVTISNINLQIGPTTVSGGTQTDYVFSGTNTLIAGGSTLKSLSQSDGTVDIVYIPSFDPSPDPSAPSDVTTFTVAVPNNDPPGKGSHSWVAYLAGNGNLIPSHLLPQALPPISAWTGVQNSNLIEISSGSAITKIPITAVGRCSTGGGSSGVPPQALGDPTSLEGCPVCGQPISIGSGNMFEQADDYHTAGPNRLAFLRYYNSMAASTPFATSLGKNWRSNYDRYLNISATSVVAERPDGQQVTFTLNGGAWTTDADIDLTLTNSGSSWTLTDQRDTVETYSNLNASQGILQTIRARNGYTQTLQYNASNQISSVTDSFNRQLSFIYNNGLLQSVTTPDGLALTYGFTPSGGSNMLTSVSYSTTPATNQTYLYENSSFPAALTGIVDENGARYRTWTYDSSGRALTSQGGNGADLVTVAYNDTDGSRTVTGPLGQPAVYHFAMVQNVPKVTEIDFTATSTTAAFKSTYTYDSNGYIASRVDGNGNTMSFVNDAHGQPTSIVEAAGTPQARTTTTVYHPTFRLPVQIVSPALTAKFTYDNSGEMLTCTLTDTTVNTAPYSTKGQARTWVFTWANFLLASLKGPRTDLSAVTTFAYDASGTLTALTNPLSQTTQVTQHLPGGLPLTVVDANHVTTNLTYDARQRLLASSTSTAAGLLMTRNTYDAAGDLTTITLPDGAGYTNSYDSAHRLINTSDLLNQSVNYALDASGDIILAAFKDANNVTQRSRSEVFDALGRSIQVIGGASQTRSYNYDLTGNLTTVTDGLQHTRQQVFDALNRIVRMTDSAQGITNIAYDPMSRPASVTDPNGATTQFTYDGFGDLIQEVSPTSGATVYYYDPAGNLIQKVDARGVTSNYAYDALNRRISVTYPGNSAENVTLTYDQGAFGIGRLTSLTDAAGRLSRTYDERGNLLSETRTHGTATLLTAYTYDAASRVASISYPSGWLINYTRDTMGRITAASAMAPGGGTPQSVVSAVTYEPFGPVKTLIHGNGILEQRSFDPDYRLTQLSAAGSAPVQSLTYAYDAANNVLSIGDRITSGSSQSFGYDALNRLTSAAGAYGSLGYSYDANGNRIAQSDTPATKDGLGAITAFSYNQAGRLASASAGTQQLAQYTYDAFGQRAAKVGSTTATTLYQYSGGHLLEESDGQGNAQVDYVYLNGLPVATIQTKSNKVYFVHDDRLGTPQMATDSAQSVVWSTNYQPFGQISNAPAVISQDLRLPGQETDLETGLYHNGFRDYAPGSGKYIESDPAGLIGGLNRYAYADDNPVNTTDPTGLVSNDCKFSGICTFWEQIQLDITDSYQKVYQVPQPQPGQTEADYNYNLCAGLQKICQGDSLSQVGAVKMGESLERVSDDIKEAALQSAITDLNWAAKGAKAAGFFLFEVPGGQAIINLDEFVQGLTAPLQGQIDELKLKYSKAQGAGAAAQLLAPCPYQQGK